MSALSDAEIRTWLSKGFLVKSPVPEAHINPASVDLSLGRVFKVFKHAQLTHIDVREPLSPDFFEVVTLKDSEPMIVHPGEFVLGVTEEEVKIPDSILCRIDGKSSLARIGILVHSTAGLVNPGHEGKLTLEISNISKVPVKLWAGTRVCQLTFEELSSPARTPYNKRMDAKYQGEKEPGHSKIHKDYSPK